MSRSRATVADVSAVLSHLPTDHLVFVLEGAWMVVGPTGLFVLATHLGDPDDDVEQASERAAEQASSMRARLAEQLAWVPFVDAFVVTAGVRGERTEGLGCPTVPLQRLAATIAEAPRTVDEETLAQLARLGVRRV